MDRSTTFKEMGVEWKEKKTDGQYMERLRQKVKEQRRQQVKEQTTEDECCKFSARQKKEAVKKVTGEITKLVSVWSTLYAL